MLALVAALVLQVPSPGAGPFVDVSNAHWRTFVDQSRIERSAGRAKLVTITLQTDGRRREQFYDFDCSALTYASSSYQIIAPNGEVEMSGHYQLRPATRPVSDEAEALRALACDGTVGDREVFGELPLR